MYFKQLLTKTLLVAVGLCVGQSAWAQASYNHSYTVSDGVSIDAAANQGYGYFLYNVGAGKFFTGGRGWGTFATADHAGKIVELISSDSNYKIHNKHVSANGTGAFEGYLPASLWADNTSETTANQTWTFTKVGDENKYTIYNTAQSKYLYYGTNTELALGESVTGDEYYWIIVPKSARDAAGDYTYYLQNQGFNRPWERQVWNDISGDSNKATAFPIFAMNWDEANPCAEKYHAVFNLYQTISETVPNGKYTVYAQAFYRNDGTGAAPTLYANGDHQELGLLNANGEATTEDMDGASAAFTAGQYVNEVTTVVTDGKLKVGIDISQVNQWVIWDNFELQYLGTCLVNDAEEFTSGSTMTANKWYYIDASASEYTISAGSNLSDVVYTTDGTQLTASATASDHFTATQTLTATRYYFYSTVEQTLTFGRGLTQEYYDFQAARTSSNIGCSTTGWINVNKTSSNIIANERIEMNDRFAAQFGSGRWMIHKDKALYSANNAVRKFAILNLKAGDRIAINFPYNLPPTFSGTPNAYISSDGDVNAGTALVSGTYYTIKEDGMLALEAPNYAQINSIDIWTSAPVLSKPSISFNGLVENNGLYYTQVTLSSTDEDVKFYNGSGVEITSPYRFTTHETLTVYAGKDNRTNSAKVSYEGGEYILANSFAATSLKTSDFSSNGGGNDYYYMSNPNNSDNTTLVPGLTFWSNNQNSWAVKYSGANVSYIEQRNSKERTVSCTVLDANRMASITKHDSSVNWLTNGSNNLSFGQWSGMEAYQLFTKSDATVSVTIGSTGYSTFSSPVPLDFSGVSGLTAYVATTINGQYVHLDAVASAPANTGLVLGGEAGQTYTIPVTASAATPETNMMVGCIVQTSVAQAATSYVLVNNEGIPEFQSLEDYGATIPTGKAYLSVPANNARALYITFGDETNGINSLQTSKTETKNNKFIYNLNGQRVDKPAKGVYIVNGKKVIVK